MKQIMEILEWSIYGLNQWTIYDLNGWLGIYGLMGGAFMA